MLLLQAVGLQIPSASAQTTTIPVYSVTQQDLNGNGDADVAMIETAFATERDRVLVYDRQGDMPWGSEWQAVTDFLDDIWVFDVSADGTAQLIIVFDREGEQYVAMVYVDIDGDGQVSYRLAEGKIIIEESPYWYVKVETSRLWSQPGGLLDAPVVFSNDGFRNSASSGRGIQGNDGEVDRLIEIGDKDRDGVNDYQLRWMPGSNGTQIWVQVENRRPDPYAGAIFWPLLIDKQSSHGSYFDHPPAIVVDWEAGAIDGMGILGFPIENGYHIYSYLTMDKYAVNAANFENPMAYYDIANDQDGWPELQYRFNVKVPHDPYFPAGRWGTVATPNLEVHISWDQNNLNAWQYKLSLASNDAIDTRIQFPDFAIVSVPHDRVISWVDNRTWDMATFTQDYNPSRDSEGMFAKGWQVNRGWLDDEYFNSLIPDNFMTGYSDQLPLNYFQDTPEAMRGEYSFHYYDTPKIYLSSLDRQLHLLGAEAGVWNRGEGHRLRYANLNTDSYLDQWQDERDGTVVQQLNYAAGVYVYSGNDQVRFKLTELPPALLETRPPGDHDEWQRLGAQLKDHQITLEPDDFAGMLDQLPGSELRIQGAAARDFRIMPEGFRFILEMQPNFRASQNDQPLILLPALPGNYAVDFDGQTWSVEPATPAVLGVSNIEVSTESGAAQDLRWTTVEVLLRNDGLEDVHDLPVCLTLDNQIGRRIVMTDTVALLPGEGQQRIAWQWAPPTAGAWQVQVAAYCGGAEPTAVGGELLAEAVMEVSETGKPSLPWLISLGESVPETVVLFLFAAVTMVGAVAAVWVRRSGL